VVDLAVGHFLPIFKGETLFVEVQQNVHNQFLPRKKQKAKTNENQKKIVSLNVLLPLPLLSSLMFPPEMNFLQKKVADVEN
jgi:hypothetical protein